MIQKNILKYGTTHVLFSIEHTLGNSCNPLLFLNSVNFIFTLTKIWLVKLPFWTVFYYPFFSRFDQKLIIYDSSSYPGNRGLNPVFRLVIHCIIMMGSTRSLYFVSPRERPWRQRVFWRKTLVIARATCVFSHAFKKEHWDWRIKDASCSVSLGTLSDVTVVLGMRQSIVWFPAPVVFTQTGIYVMDTYKGCINAMKVSAKAIIIRNSFVKSNYEPS